ncbi:MAG TPA: hypothetical protein VGX51_02550 [Solirubrobacteraceae bacterium]|nr:hypothetical protein [Solirubrobacteraceae bacterium]
MDDLDSLAAVVASASAKLPDCSGLVHLLTRRFQRQLPATRPAPTPKLPADPWWPQKIETR